MLFAKPISRVAGKENPVGFLKTGRNQVEPVELIASPDNPNASGIRTDGPTELEFDWDGGCIDVTATGRH